MFALGWILFLTIIFVVSGLLQILLYAISFRFLLKNKLEDFFEEIDTKNMILMSIFIVYLLPIPMSFLFDPVEDAILIRATLIKDYQTASLLISLLPYIICFFILFYFFWKKLILKNTKNTNFKIAFVFYLAFLPFALITIFMLFADMLSWVYLFW